MLLKSSSGLSPQLTSSDAFFVGRLIDQNGLITGETSEKVSDCHETRLRYRI